MKKKIAILGSTGSIGVSTLNVIKKNIDNFEIVLLSANKNYKKLFKQATLFKVKNLIISDKKVFSKIIRNNLKRKFHIYNDYNSFMKIFNNKKIDYVMSAISGINGLNPSLKIIKHTKKIAIANKEALICGWGLLKKEFDKNNVEFIPVDSEHFSIWFSINKYPFSNISSIYLTASGGPFLNRSLKDLSKIKVSSALNHPNWKMGKKITIDSATMMNKVFEIIEARNIFNFNLNQLFILIHPKSYIHALIKFKNNMIKIIAHNTTMEIPISGSLLIDKYKDDSPNSINLNLLNNLKLKKINKKRFPVLKILEKLNNNHSLYETVIISANDSLVELFLDNKISFNQISEMLLNFIQKDEFTKYKKIKPKNVEQIKNLDNYVRLKIKTKVV